MQSDYKQQLDHVLANSAALFNDDEKELHDLFVKHVEESPTATRVIRKCRYSYFKLLF